MKVMDLFCGTGGFSKGFENAGGFEVIYGIDVLEVAVETFRLNHPTSLAVAGDIRAIRLKEVAEKLGIKKQGVDIIVGGPPCQGFSSIRPFRSSDEDDARNTLFEEFAAYVNYFRPPVFVMENVVGLATYKSGSTIEQIQECFKSLGYETDWKILNAAHYGVPQKRERLVMIGAQAGIPLRFPSPTHSGEFRTIGIREKGRRLAPPVDGAPATLFEPEQDKLPRAVTVMDAIGDLPPVASGEWAHAYTLDPANDFQAARRRNSESLEWHVSTAHSERMLEIIRHSGSNISSIPAHLISSGFSSCYSRLEPDEPAVTITVNFVHPASNKCIHPVQDRALTLREGARLQSYDDDFKFAGGRMRIAKQIGNAVPPLLGQAIASSVLDMMGAQRRGAA